MNEQNNDNSLREANPRYKWAVTFCVMIGSLLVVLDTVIVNVGLPNIMASFGTNLDTIQWVVTSYMLTMAIMMPTSGWAGEVLGHKNLYLLSMSVFLIGSIFCALSWNIESLIFFRALQGIGGGALMPISMVIIFEVFPQRQRGLAMGVYGLGVSMGPAIGPTVGGYLIDKFDWPAMFWINIPIGIGGLLATMIIVKEIRPRRSLKFDWFGFATLSLFLITFLLALSRGRTEGWGSNYIITLFLISMLSLVAFLIIELRTPQPLIDLKLYRITVYTVATIVSVFVGMVMFSVNFLTPLFLQNVIGMDALQTGMMVFPGALVAAVFLPTSGWLSDRTDPRIPIFIGIAGFLVSTYLGTKLNVRSSDAYILAMILTRGVGLAMIFPPLLNTAMGYIQPSKLGMASGLLNVTRQIGGTFGVAITGTLLGTRVAVHEQTMGEAVEASSMGAQNAISGLQGLLHGSGMTDFMAHNASLSLIKQYISGQALASAFDDSFWVLFVIFSFVTIPTLILRKRKGGHAHP